MLTAKSPMPLRVPSVLWRRDSQSDEARGRILNRPVISHDKLGGRVDESNDLRKVGGPRKEVGGNLNGIIDVGYLGRAADCHRQILLAAVLDDAPGQKGARRCRRHRIETERVFN